MSSVAPIPSSVASASKLSPQIVYVGNSLVLEEVRRAIKDPMVCFKMDPLSSKNPRDLTWVRNLRVVRKDGVHLIPYPIRDPQLEGRFKSLLPPSSNRFILSCVQVGYGIGFEEARVKQAIATAQKTKQPFLRATTCIEGGNYLLTDDGAGVGIHSVILSMIALQEQALFDEGEITERAQAIEKPGLQFLRMARNSALYVQKRPFDEKGKDHKGGASLHGELQKLFGGHSGYKKLLTAPVTIEERTKYLEAGKKWQARWEITLEVMAKELGIKRKNLFILKQARYHIDLDMVLGPDRLVLVQDPQQSLDLLDDLARRSIHSAKKHFSDLYSNAKLHVEEQNAIFNRNASNLAALKLKIVPVPGAFSDAAGERVNFLNGLFIPTSQGLFYVTHGITKRFDDHLLEAFANSISRLPIKPIFLDSLQEILIAGHGSFHCLTWQAPGMKKEASALASVEEEQQVPAKDVAIEKEHDQPPARGVAEGASFAKGDREGSAD